MSNAELNSMLNKRSQATLKSRAQEINDINSKIEQVNRLVDDQADPDWKTLALGLLTKLQDPIHGMILGWNDWWMAHNGLGLEGKWDPDHNVHHMMRSEVNDIYKAMTRIRMLENKLRNYDMNSGTTNADWNLLNSLKREVGIPVEFANEK